VHQSVKPASRPAASITRVSLAQWPKRSGKRSWRAAWPMLGPAFVAAVAYVDPGNFATNFSGGASFGYRLLWVVVAANLMAMLIQALTAKLGAATGRDLATLCRERLPRPVVWGLWLQAEAVAVATDLAEVIGGSIALNLLFGVPLPIGGAITAVIAFALLAAQARGRRAFETVIVGLLSVIGAGFLYDVVFSGVDTHGVAAGLVPGFAGTDSLILATGILGATVMPHVIYAHSALTRVHYTGKPAYGSGAANEATTVESVAQVQGRRSVLRAQRLDVVLAMGAAGIINVSMLIVAAQVFTGDQIVSSLEDVHAGLARLLSPSAALAFALALLASGLAASAVGTYAGQIVMEGFLRRRIPLLLRRAITIAPALLILLLGFDPTTALVWSQVVLSFGIPFALVPLVRLTSDSALMGAWVNRRVTTVVASGVAAVIVALNLFLLYSLTLG
jgi:manganese transport protein